MIEQIEALQIGQTLNATGTRKEINDLVRSCHGSYNVVRITADSFLIVRVKESARSLSALIAGTLSGLKPFCSEFVPGDIQYIRSVVSRYGRNVGRVYSVSKQPGGAMVAEDFRKRSTFTEIEFNAFRLALMDAIKDARAKVVEVPVAVAFDGPMELA